jgi:hypothetical protein
MGKKYTQEELGKSRLKFMTILDFKAEYGIKFTVEAIGYHMKTNKIDWAQPVRDRFVVLSKKTLEFYEISL